MGATRFEVIAIAAAGDDAVDIHGDADLGSLRLHQHAACRADLVNSGIGFLIEYYSGIFDATGTYAAILVLVIMSVGLTELLTQVEARMSRGR